MKETLKRLEILRRQRDLAHVRAAGRRVAGQVLYLRYAPSPSTEPPDRKPARRIAFLLACGINGAVERNRLKRRLREVYRRNKGWFPEGFDYMLHATPDAADLEYRHLAHHVETLTRKLKEEQTKSDCRLQNVWSGKRQVST